MMLKVKRVKFSISILGSFERLTSNHCSIYNLNLTCLSFILSFVWLLDQYIDVLRVLYR
jgi:hypothetical protein